MSKMKDAAAWFKEQFHPMLQSGTQGTPFDPDLLTAIAMQETYYIWGDLYQRMEVAEVLKLCVGDTFDAPNRKAFPKNKAALLKAERGAEMFSVAREALESLGKYISRYHKVAIHNPNKFCHGFGIFQYDIQFFTTNPDFFLQRRWYHFDDCLALCVQELKAALKRAYGPDKSTLTDEEKVYVAIAYNRGSVDFTRGFKQGYKDDSGKYYGEHIWFYLQLAKSIS
jgi:hypothetical protein